MTILNFLYWSDIINNLYNLINEQETEEKKFKKIAKLMKKDKTYGVTECQRGDVINNYKFYIDILNGGNVLDDEYSRQVFVNNPYITKNKKFPNLIFFQIDNSASFNDIIKSLKIKNSILKPDLYFNDNEKFKVHQHLIQSEFVFIYSDDKSYEKLSEIINELKDEIKFVQINPINEDNKKIPGTIFCDKILSYREMLYYTSFSKLSIGSNELNSILSNFNTEFLNTNDINSELIRLKYNKNLFINLDKNIFLNLKLTDKEIQIGKQSRVEFYEISDENKNYINNKINYNIDNIIVKKTYIDVKDDPNPNLDNQLILNMGGKYEQMKREICSLKKLYKKDHFPTLLHVDFENFCIYLSYCGVPLNNKNLPKDFNKQIENIILALENENISNNDMWINNFLVKDKTLYLIDFGYSLDKNSYPLANIDMTDIDNIKDPILFLTDTVKSREKENKYNFKKYFLNTFIENKDIFMTSINEFEDLHLLNNNRKPEIHTIIAWDGVNDYEKTKDYLKNLPSNFRIIQDKIIKLNQQEQRILINSIYHSRMHNRVKNDCIYLIVVEDMNPIYSYEKATKCWQVLNKNMKVIKEKMREVVGGSNTNYGCIHTSYNVEESLLVLESLKLQHLVPRIKFDNFEQLFNVLNNDKKLKYIIQRSFFELDFTPQQYGPKKDVDILVNDYYYFKSITGSRTDLKYRNGMREDDNGPRVLNTINIGNCEIRFDIRFIGDNYIDSIWERNMLNNRIIQKLNNFEIYIPNTEDEIYSLIYNIIVQKPNPQKNKHIPRVQELANKLNMEKLDFSNIKKVWTNLQQFMANNNYKFKKPHDNTVEFNINW